MEDQASDFPAFGEFSSDHDGLRAELESLRNSHRELRSKTLAMEETIYLLRTERDELTRAVREVSGEKDSLSGRMGEFEASIREMEDEFAARMEGLRIEAEIYRERIGELVIERGKSNDLWLKCLDSAKMTKGSLIRIIDSVDGEKVVTADADFADGAKQSDSTDSELSKGLIEIARLASEAEEKVNLYKESRKKEKKEYESSVVSLTEENRDINNLLRVALLEKEAVERRLKGSGDQKRVAILQIAERGLQRVGFGFMMGSGNAEQASESSGTKLEVSSGNKSDSSEFEEEVVSLASTVERIMKNLRLEITQLRRSLEESRSDTERLQSLAEKQARDIAENGLYIEELEYRERVLAQNVEELLTSIRETEAEVDRWREACELEVEAAKVEIGERDKVVAIMKQELEKTKAALDVSNGKLKLKEQLAAAAMGAQAAVEKSLELADSRAVGLHARIEDLSRQLEEAESREHASRKLRRVCWPWRAVKVNTTNNVRRMLPEMQALLH